MYNWWGHQVNTKSSRNHWEVELVQKLSTWGRYSSYKSADLHRTRRRVGDQQLLIGGFRPNQENLGYKVNFITFLTRRGSSSNWNQVKTNFCLGDIKFLNRKILHLPYLEPLGYGRLQSHVWRLGGFLIQLEAPNITSSFILSHWIKSIQSCLIIHQELPYMDPRAFKAQHQRLSSDLVRLKGVIRRLIRHGIIQKLSRYKSSLQVSLFGQYTTISSNGHMH